MTQAEALADLTEISSQIEAAVLVDGRGRVSASTLADAERAKRLAAGARKLLDEAAAAGPGGDPVQVEASTARGSVFVVRSGKRLIAAVTGPDPTVGLVFYDLKTCLRAVEQSAPKRKPGPRRKEAADGAA